MSTSTMVRAPPVLVQPEAADDVAAALAVAAVGAPVNGTVELAEPERLRLDELARRVPGANGDPRVVTADGRARYFGAELDDRSLIPGDDARIAPTRFVEDRHPAEALVQLSVDAELLVVGSRGRGGFSELLLGSVSHAAVLHAVCPVVVVPPARDER